MNELETLLVDTGTIQFGRFGSNSKPFHENLSLLPSYPTLLQMLSQIAVQEIDAIGDISRLVTTIDSLPIATAISLTTRIPLVYSLGSDQPGVRDLVGAYDVGHPACLILNQWDETIHFDVNQLIEKAGRVGLEISHVLLVLDTVLAQSASQIRVHSLINLNDYVETLRIHDRLPKGQADAVQSWLKNTKRVRGTS